MLQKCVFCFEEFCRKHIRFCHGCKGWYCRDCVVDHKPCKPVRSVNSTVKKTIFNIDRFREFQASAGYLHGQIKAQELWVEVRNSLTETERRQVLDTWAMVSSQKSYRSHSVLQNKPGCLLDEVCNIIVHRREFPDNFLG